MRRIGLVIALVLFALTGLVALAATPQVAKPAGGPVPAATVPAPGAPTASNAISLCVLSGYAPYVEGASEIVAFDPTVDRMYITNGDSDAIDIIDVSTPTSPTLVSSLDLSAYGDGPTSVDAYEGVVAATVKADPEQDPGMVVLMDSDGTVLAAVTAGALPDMVGFTPDGTKVLAANEGEPNDDYDVDPEGSVTVIDLSGGAANVTQDDVTQLGFGHLDTATLDPKVRVFGPGATLAQDLEPEYIAFSPDSTKAWVACQENNALGIINLETMTITQVVGLGFKDHSLPGNGLDASDKDDEINITTWPVMGMYQPDMIKAFDVDGETYIVSANEGDARDYDGYSEEVRVDDLTLDPNMPMSDTLVEKENLGRLKTTIAGNNYDTTFCPDPDQDGDVDQIYAYGARSFSIWNADGGLVYDSGDDFEQITAAMVPEWFNSEADDGFEARSDDKGPEPEAATVGMVGGRTYAFIGLERIGGVMIYDVSDPTAPVFVNWVNNRVYSTEITPEALDLGPEGLEFVCAEDSPTGVPWLIVANEVSGSTTIFEIIDNTTTLLYLPLVLD